ncbi:hypothetical protein [Vibrio sp. Sgm 5]|uniref:hypothetical protein n=1 Tax=Vibrio sp. Sgm 5 TaxID=2994387 RepID=UPI002248FE24|nr:hypothetical protein [Vibrio sp. Sgm 5]MCX2790695.1 hypothetical protein [Vibrio sp. Sgm 5]
MKKTTVLLTALTSMIAAPCAFAGTASFQWNGEVPAITTDSAKFWIVTPDGQSLLSATDTTSAKLTFRNDAGVVDLVSSQEYSFKVVKNATSIDNDRFDPATDDEAVAYQIALTELKVSQDGGFVESGNDYFAIDANNTALALNPTAPVARNAGQVTNVVVAKAEGRTNPDAGLQGAAVGTAVIVQAKIVVTIPEL